MGHHVQQISLSIIFQISLVKYSCCCFRLFFYICVIGKFTQRRVEDSYSISRISLYNLFIVAYISSRSHSITVSAYMIVSPMLSMTCYHYFQRYFFYSRRFSSIYRHLYCKITLRVLDSFVLVYQSAHKLRIRFLMSTNDTLNSFLHLTRPFLSLIIPMHRFCRFPHTLLNYNQLIPY